MAEIKLNDGFTTEVNAFLSAAAPLDSVNASSISKGATVLPTVEAYQTRLFYLKSLTSDFKALVEKDAADLKALAISLRQTDSGK